jgi:hypothetical protein
MLHLQAVIEALKQDADVHRKFSSVTVAAGSNAARLKAVAMLLFLYLCVLPVSGMVAFYSWVMSRIRRCPHIMTVRPENKNSHQKSLGTAIVSGNCRSNLILTSYQSNHASFE